MKKEEEILSFQLSKYLQLQHPNILFHYDFGSGMKMTMGQAIRQKRLNPYRGWCDLFIAQPTIKYSGLFIELKKETPFKINGEIKTNDHLKEQKQMIDNLNRLGYYACFSWDFEQTVKLINNYINNNL